MLAFPDKRHFHGYHSCGPLVKTQGHIAAILISRWNGSAQNNPHLAGLLPSTCLDRYSYKGLFPLNSERALAEDDAHADGIGNDIGKEPPVLEVKGITLV